MHQCEFGFNQQDYRLDMQEYLKCLKGEKVNVPRRQGHGIGGPIEDLAVERLKLWNSSVCTEADVWNAVLSYRQGYRECFVSDVFFPDPYWYVLSQSMKAKVTQWTPQKPIINASQQAMVDYAFFDNSGVCKEPIQFGETITNLMRSGDVMKSGDVKAERIDGGDNNLISADRMYGLCVVMHELGSYDTINLDYVSIVWEPSCDQNVLVVDVLVKDLFKEWPESFAINFTAALQIQSSPKNWTQDFKGTRQEWCRRYIEHYISKRQHYYQAKLDETYEIKKEIELMFKGD